MEKKKRVCVYIYLLYGNAGFEINNKIIFSILPAYTVVYNYFK